MDKLLLKIPPALTSAVDGISSIASAAKTIQFLGLALTPPIILTTLLVLCVSSIVIYLSIEFASKNRFRGISFGIFSKLISLNQYISKFNDQMYQDFVMIHKYVNSCAKVENRDRVCFSHATLNEIHSLMDRVKKRAAQHQNKTEKDVFIGHISNFFYPNPSFEGDALEAKALTKIFTDLYGNKFHDDFSDWLQHKSIWSFVYTDDDIDVVEKLLPRLSDEKMNEAIEAIKNGDKETEGMAILTKTMKEMVLTTIKKDMFSDILNSYSKDRKRQIEENIGSLFFKETKTLDYGKISQHFEDNCSLLNEQAKKELLDKLKQNGFNDPEKFSRLNRGISFIDALQRLHGKSYKVQNKDIFQGVPNLHPHIKNSLVLCMKEPKIRRASLMIDACFQVFNEFIYSKEEGRKFVFLKGGEVENYEKNELAKNCLALFNAHTFCSNKIAINRSKEFVKSYEDEDELQKVVSTLSSGHVSIARLKFMIQDYFVIVSEYNDKSNPDKNDIRDFWEKRVNAFGFKIPGTKPQNRPRDARNIDYISNRTQQERSANPFEEDLDRILKKNTPFELYKEYLKAVFIDMRHPKIPFFQSIMATIRYFIPDPNTVIDNFLAQLDGRTPRRTRNPTNYDFSLRYNPYVSIAEGYADFSGNINASKLNSKFDLSVKDPAGAANFVGKKQRNIEDKKNSGVATMKSHTARQSVSGGGGGGYGGSTPLAAS